MKNIAIGIMMLILLSVLIQPLLEIANVLREKVMLNSAISNASRVARDSSFIYEDHRGLDAKLDEDKFIDEFIKAFESAMNATASISGTTITFTSNDDKFHPVIVTLAITEETNYTEQTITKVKMNVETRYMFKRRLLQLVEETGYDIDYYLRDDSTLILKVTN